MKIFVPLLICKQASKLQVSQNVLCLEDNKVIKSTSKRKFANVSNAVRSVETVQCRCVGLCLQLQNKWPCNKVQYIYYLEVREVSQSTL